MEPIYGETGSVEGWLDNGIFYNLSGSAMLFLKNEHIYSFQNGEHKGRFLNGLIRDHAGTVVGFMNKAIGGPMKPLKSLLPLRPLKSLTPLKPITQTPPIKPLDTLSWSKINLSDFIG
ncbi:hypothetical protein SPSIL_008920 [Sporomusa silvacetica DSM 10669]|uniref:4-fold beta flower domain-containing protein n=1 Tax=Sporomusa silvacetica DSM 10669 TaxID=1123289 RepID=A0ABZ3IHE5_9FIRM|nr:hypothetical protein [Sporomusa silvacetica]OZC13148.1 hypothetical protein SPSIL_56040 [Sporomusa silvacetica DSM 10669]